jgi:hypothetical protein
MWPTANLDKLLVAGSFSLDGRTEFQGPGLGDTWAVCVKTSCPQLLYVLRIVLKNTLTSPSLGCENAPAEIMGE